MADKEVKKILNLSDFTEQIKKTLGKDTIVNAEEVESYSEVIQCTPISLRNALGIGGYAKRKLYLIDGETSGGKSTLLYDAIANEQKKNGSQCLLLDREDSYTKNYGKLMGIDNSKLTVMKPETLEDMYAAVNMALDSKLFGVIGVDIVTAFAPTARLEGSEQMGIESRVNSDKSRDRKSVV